MSERLDRFNARKGAKQADGADTPRLVGLPAAPVDPTLLGTVDHNFVDRVAHGEQPADLSVCRAEVDDLLSRMAKDSDRQRFELLIKDARRGILQSIAGPFGLGAVVGAADKVGGKVDTVHNARQGVYATKAAADAYANRGEYDSAAYHSHTAYKTTNAKHSELHEAGTLTDVHTGQVLDRASPRNLDHINAAHTIHNDAGRVLADVSGPELANRDANLGSTHESINKSKKAESAAAFNDKLDSGREQRRATIDALTEKSASTPLTDKERKELTKLQAKDSVSREHSEAAAAKAKTDGDAAVDKAYYTSKGFAGSVALQGGREAVTVGVQQAFGQLLTELFVGIFEEAEDWHRNGRKELAMTDELLSRFKRVAARVASKWADAVDAFRDGAIAGLLNNIVSTLVNVFLTTQKRLARMVREGFLSLIRAVKMVVFPPEGASYRETLHEATKVAFAGGIVIGGIVLEEIIHGYISTVPGLGFLADMATAVIVGSLTAVVMALSAYALDKLDLFGVAEARQLQQTTATLDDRRLDHVSACETMLLELEKLGDPANVVLGTVA
jgi:hypothetical protein